MNIVGVKDDNAFAEHLLMHGGVAVVPGSGFGAPGSHAPVVRVQHADAGRSAAAHGEDAAGRASRLSSI